jgi:hypothetical protein
MSDRIALAATVTAVVLAGLAFYLLSLDRPVISGTLFVLTSFSIYVREKYK